MNGSNKPHQSQIIPRTWMYVRFLTPGGWLCHSVQANSARSNSLANNESKSHGISLGASALGILQREGEGCAIQQLGWHRVAVNCWAHWAVYLGILLQNDLQNKHRSMDLRVLMRWYCIGGLWRKTVKYTAKGWDMVGLPKKIPSVCDTYVYDSYIIIFV